MAPPTASDDERTPSEIAAAAAEANEAGNTTPLPSGASAAATPASASNASGGDSTEEEEDGSDSNEDDSNESSDDDDEDDDDEEDSSSDNEDADEEAEPMEVEAVPTEDQDEDEDEDDGTTSAAAAAKAVPAPAVPPVPATEQPEQQQQRKMTPKMRIKLSLKAKAAAAASEHFPPPPPSSSGVPASAVESSKLPAGAAVSSGGSDMKKKVASTSINTDKTNNDDDDVIMAEAHVGDNDDDDGEVIATAEIVEDAPSAATDARTSSAKSKSKPSATSATNRNNANKLVEGHPLHKPSRERAPPPSLSRPQSKNPQLAYTSAAGQGGGYHSRAMRFPSILSPGMLAIPNHSNNVGTAVCDTDAYRMLHGREVDSAKLLDSEGAAGTGAGGSGGDNHDDPYEKYITADSVFTHYMGAQGYTAESRASNPHRGSSIQRTVGDMFDNDVMSSINFPNLLPDYLRSRRAPKKGGSKNSLSPGKEAMAAGSTPEKSTPSKDDQSSAACATGTTTTPSDVSPKADTPTKSDTPKKAEGSPAKVKMDAMDMLKSTLSTVLEKRKAAENGQQGAVKRFRPLQFQDMVPVSLTFPYPEEYTKARIEYARKVKEREDAIAQDQVASQSAADIMENYNREKAKWEEKLTQWEKDKAEHKEKVVAWEKDQIERKERLAQWEKGRAEVEAAAAALAKKCASPKNSDASPSKEATAETDAQDKEEKEDGNAPAKSSDEPPASNAPATDSKVVPSGVDGDTKQAEEAQVLGPPRPQTPPQPTEPVLPPLPAPVSIPPIPVSPSPPRWDASNGTDGGGAQAERFQRPSPETLKRYATNLAHLDPATYVSTVPTPRARYVALSSNSIADANFVGPAAHGIAGIGLGLGSGLSTAYTGASGGQGGGGLHSSSYYEGLKRFADHMGYSDVSKVSPAKKKKSSSSSGSSPNDANKEKNKFDKGSKPKLPKIKLKMPSLPPGPKGEGTSSSELKSLFETGGQDAEDMRVTIVKATIYAARVGKAAGDKFVGSDGKVYDEIGKAFSHFAGIKPCERCRKSKQGALMCRVRRKHKDEDYDGGKSADELQQYFKADLKTLIRKES